MIMITEISYLIIENDNDWQRSDEVIIVCAHSVIVASMNIIR